MIETRQLPRLVDQLRILLWLQMHLTLIGLVVVIVWGVLVVALGMTQDSLLTGDLHWLIKVVHLLVGLGAIGQAESLAVRTKRRVNRNVAPLSAATAR